MATVHLVKTPDQWIHQASEQPEGRTGFGDWLRRAREARGLTLADITRETKIPLRNLEALEHGNLGFVPAFYERAEVRAIARAVGVDEGLAIGRLDSAIAPVVPEPKPRVAVSTHQIGLQGMLGALALALLVWAVSNPGRSWFGGAAEPVPTRVETSPVVPNGGEPVTRPSEPSSADIPVVAPAAATPVATPVAVRVETAVAAPVAPAEVTTEVAAPSGTVTQLVVRTEPAGARVTVNGIGWGVSPVTIRHLPPGTKHIRITKEGFASTERVLTIDTGQRQAIDFQLNGAP